MQEEHHDENRGADKDCVSWIGDEKMVEKQKQKKCHCCGSPDGGRFGICENCISQGGSIERRCSKHGHNSLEHGLELENGCWCDFCCGWHMGYAEGNNYGVRLMARSTCDPQIHKIEMEKVEAEVLRHRPDLKEVE